MALEAVVGSLRIAAGAVVAALGIDSSWLDLYPAFHRHHYLPRQRQLVAPVLIRCHLRYPVGHPYRPGSELALALASPSKPAVAPARDCRMRQKDSAFAAAAALSYADSLGAVESAYSALLTARQTLIRGKR